MGLASRSQIWQGVSNLGDMLVALVIAAVQSPRLQVWVPTEVQAWLDR